MSSGARKPRTQRQRSAGRTSLAKISLRAAIALEKARLGIQLDSIDFRSIDDMLSTIMQYIGYGEYISKPVTEVDSTILGYSSVYKVIFWFFTAKHGSDFQKYERHFTSRLRNVLTDVITKSFLDVQCDRNYQTEVQMLTDLSNSLLLKFRLGYVSP